jgi:signal peptidase II
MKFILFLSLPLYALDQITKWLVIHHVDPDMPTRVIPGYFDIVYVTNTGAAFGSFRNNNTFFIVLSCAALVFILGLLVRRHRPDFWRDLSLGLLLAGVMGNLTDRFMHARVIDFLLFNLHVPFANPWPAFNVADSCICVAVCSFIIHSLRQNKRATQAAQRL